MVLIIILPLFWFLLVFEFILMMDNQSISIRVNSGSFLGRCGIELHHFNFVGLLFVSRTPCHLFLAWLVWLILIIVSTTIIQLHVFILGLPLRNQVIKDTLIVINHVIITELGLLLVSIIVIDNNIVVVDVFFVIFRLLQLFFLDFHQYFTSIH